ncbi:hypothetical protein H9X96_20085 [Pedobacter sp. N36a]|uniref:cyclophilin-like fold protein n=1 Tax=Pedobacter sp. N36a TaxID=2767996 RepID=UPI00165706E6|nr:cyclophilin-like fold protein [Pedobacter sp. N36a]MBC8988061.1 hypothetical protein [Pedobacter sp. N36a]
MKHSFLVSALLMLMIGGRTSSCDKKDNTINPNTIDKNNHMVTNKIKVQVGSKTFIATLSDNSSAKAFMNMLPMTINLAELNGNEKYFDLSKSLPTNSANPGTIQNGDLMLYGSRTLVLFYKSFSTSYSYTRIGRIDHILGFAEALGAREVGVAFELN